MWQPHETDHQSETSQSLARFNAKPIAQKPLFKLISSVIMLSLVAACSGGTSSTDITTPTPTPTPVPTPTPTPTPVPTPTPTPTPVPTPTPTPTPVPTPTPTPDTLSFYSDWPDIASTNAIKPDSTIETQVQSILAQMTLEEKVGQMIQPNLDQVTPAEAKEYKLGSLLNGGGSWPNNNKKSTAADWVATADSYWQALDEAYKDRGFKIPFMWATDAVHGHNNVYQATVFPHNIGLGAANNPELIYKIGQATAREIVATGLDWTFAPTVAVPRDDRWGRVYEGYSEDPEIVYNYASKMVEGLQGGGDGLKTDTQVISNVKHWLGDGGTKNGVDRGVNQSTETNLINLHAAGYFAGLKAGAQVVMSSFNSWDADANYAPNPAVAYNKKIHGSKYLITDVLKGKMGFDGIVVTDWNGHGEIAGCSAANCPDAVNAGNDVFMVTAKADWKAFYANVIQQVKDGIIPMSRIDDAVTRILRVKMRAGLWDKPKPSARSLAGNQAILGAPEHKALARQAVSESLVLLKNNNAVLPLKAEQKIFLAGSAMDNIQKQTGGWSLTWQGADNTLADFPGASTVKQALEAQIGVDNIITDKAQANADMVALVVIGEDPYAEFMGDIKDHQTLSYAELKTSYAADLQTIKDLKALGMKVVTVFLSGRPLYVNEEINHSDAFVAAWLPGTEAAGITDVLYAVEGKDFKGKLSYSWPATKCSTSINRVPPHISGYMTPINEQDISGIHAPLFPYGYGLTYSAMTAVATDVSWDLNNLPLDTRNYGCGQSEPDTGIATLPLEIYGTRATDEFVLRISGNKNGWAAIPVPKEQPADQGTVSTQPINYQGQYDAVKVTFKGDDLAQIYLQTQSEAGQDRNSYLNAESTLQFDIKVHQAPTATLNLAQHCVWPCVGQVELNKVLPAVSTEWSRLKIPLKCFAEQGMNHAAMNTPLLFLTGGAAQFDLGNVRIVPKSVDVATDAVACADLKADSGGGGSSIDLGTVTEDKAVAVGFRPDMVTALSITAQSTALNSGSLRTSSNAYEGSSSLLFSHTGVDWGGFFSEFAPLLNLSSYTNMVVAVAAPDALDQLELKFDDATGAALGKNLLSYPSTTSGIWKIYTVPLSEFVGVDKSQIKAIGFWHPKAASGSYLKSDILIDDIHFN